MTSGEGTGWGEKQLLCGTRVRSYGGRGQHSGEGVSHKVESPMSCGRDRWRSNHTDSAHIFTSPVKQQEQALSRFLQGLHSQPLRSMQEHTSR